MDKRKPNVLYVTLRLDGEDLLMCWQDETWGGVEYGYYHFGWNNGEYGPDWYRTTKPYLGEIPKEVYTHFEGAPHTVKVVKRMKRSQSKYWGDDGYMDYSRRSPYDEIEDNETSDGRIVE